MFKNLFRRSKNEPSGDNEQRVTEPGAELLHRYARGERDFDGLSLAGAQLQDAVLEGARFRGADLSGANLQGADLSATDLRNARFTDADLRAAELVDCLMVSTDLFNANLAGASLMPKCLDGSFLLGADLSNAKIICSFEDVVIGHGTKLYGTSLAFVDLSQIAWPSSTPSGKQQMQETGLPAEVLDRCLIDIETVNATATFFRTDFGQELNARKCDSNVLVNFFRLHGLGEAMLNSIFLDAASPAGP